LRKRDSKLVASSPTESGLDRAVQRGGLRGGGAAGGGGENDGGAERRRMGAATGKIKSSAFLFSPPPFRPGVVLVSLEDG